MKHWLRLSLFVALIAAAAGSACFLTGKLFPSRERVGSSVNYHFWIHRQLGLRPEQEKALEPVEEKFANRRRQLMGLIREGNRELAQALVSDKGDSAQVKAAVAKIHHAQGELQKAVLEHVFAMQPVLKPDQYERLIKMTAEALRDAPELQ